MSLLQESPVIGHVGVHGRLLTCCVEEKMVKGAWNSKSLKGRRDRETFVLGVASFEMSLWKSQMWHVFRC